MMTATGMLNFEEKVNVRDEISKGIQNEEWYKSSGDHLLTDSIYLIGRENNSTLLFRYNSQAQGAAASSLSSMKKKTHIGVCNLKESRVRTLYSTTDLNREEEIVQCTVNEQLSLLVFCVASDGPIRARGASNTRDTYLYIAEVQQGRKGQAVIAIAPDRKESAKTAQFIYGSGSDIRKHKLLVFVQNEYIGVLSLTVDSNGKLKDKVEKYKPKWPIGKHHWYQWDIDKQHLFIITNDHIENKNPLEVWVPTEKENIIEKLFSIPITMNSPSRRPRLSKYILDQRVPDRNIVALTAADGSNDATFCICNQVPYERREGKESEEPFKLSYEIISLLHGNTMRVTVADVPGNLRKLCINFILLGSYVVAYLPDVFTHVININDTMDLGLLNIFSQGEHHGRVEQWKGALSRVNLPHVRQRRSGVLMYDSDCMCVYHVSLNESSLVEEFKRRWSAEPSLPFEILKLDSLTNQMAVLQHQLQTTSDPNRSRNLLLTLKNNVTSTATVSVLTEYILGSAFAVTSRKIDNRLFCRHLPFSQTSELDRRSHRVSVVTNEKKRTITTDTTNTPTNVLIAIEDNRQIRKDCGFYNFLYLVNSKRYLGTEKRYRLSVSTACQRLEELKAAQSDKKPSLLRKFVNSVRKKDSQPNPGFLPPLDGVSSLDSSSSDSFPDSLLNEEVDRDLINGLAGVYFDFLRTLYPVNRSPTKGSRTHQSLTMEPRKHLATMEPMCYDFVRVLVSQVNVLLHHLYNIFELKELHNKMHVAAHKGDLLKAFHMFERYQYAVTELGLPLPSEFATMFATVGYQSLSPEEFLQYVRSGVVDLTEEFLNILAKDHSVEKASVKCECLARMSHDQALKWSHNLMDSPIIDATATRLVAEDIFQKYSGGFKQKESQSGGGGGRSSRKESSSSGMGEEDEDYDMDLPPSYNYMVKKITSSGWTSGTGGITTDMLERAVFYYTKDEDH